MRGPVAIVNNAFSVDPPAGQKVSDSADGVRGRTRQTARQRNREIEGQNGRKSFIYHPYLLYF